MDGPGRFLPTALLGAGALALAVGATVLEVGPSPPESHGDGIARTAWAPSVSALRSDARSAPGGSDAAARAREKSGCGSARPERERARPPSDRTGRAGFPLELFGPDPKVAAPST